MEAVPGLSAEGALTLARRLCVGADGAAEGGGAGASRPSERFSLLLTLLSGLAMGRVGLMIAGCSTARSS